MSDAPPTPRLATCYEASASSRSRQSASGTGSRHRDELGEAGTHLELLSDWKWSPEVQAVLKDWREPYRVAFVEVVAAVFEKAKTGDVPAFRALADVLGENAPQKLEQSAGTNLSLILADARWTKRIGRDGSAAQRSASSDAVVGGRAPEPARQ